VLSTPFEGRPVAPPLDPDAPGPAE
jgi:hypothetical protein